MLIDSLLWFCAIVVLPSVPIIVAMRGDDE